MNKLGLHIIYPHGYAGPLGRPATVKLLDPSTADIGAVRDAVGPDCLIVIRFYERAPALTSEGARAIFDRRRPQMLAARVVAGRNVAFESPYNEPSRGLMAHLVASELAWLEQMHRDGLRAVVGNWAVGNPDPLQWVDYMPVLDALTGGDALGCHDYWAYREDITNVWYTGRWTHPLAPDKLRQVPIVVTECGRDVISDRANHGKDPGKPGWQRTCSWDEYHDDLRLYTETVLDPAPNVIGAHVFQAGSVDRQWQPFDVAAQWPVIVSQYGAPVIPPVIPAPEPVPPQEEPSMQTIEVINTDALIIELQRPLAITPTTNRVSQWFGENPAMYAPYGLAGHNGLDYSAPVGTPIVACHHGTLRRFDQGSAGYGRYVTIDGGRYGTLYGHLSAYAAVDGADVQRGQVIGYSGNTGNSTGPHLHLGLWINGLDNPAYRNWIDPVPWRTA